MELQRIEFQKYRDFGQIISATFEFIRNNFGPLLKSIIFMVGPFIFLTGIFLSFYNRSVFTFTRIFNYSDVIPQILLSGLSAFFTVQMLITVVYSYVLIYLRRQDDSVIQIEEVWQEVKSNILRVLGVTLSITLMFLILFVIIFIPIALIVDIRNNPFAILPFMLLLMFPLIYLAIKLTLVLFVSLNEKTGVIESIKRSFYLIKNKWWFTFGLIIVLSFIQGFMGMVFQIPQWIMSFVIAFNSFDGTGVSDTTNTIMIITTVIAAFNYIFYSISLIAIAFHYFSLIEQKEAKGLFEKIESL